MSTILCGSESEKPGLAIDERRIRSHFQKISDHLAAALG